jgi:hypothetical protein
MVQPAAGAQTQAPQVQPADDSQQAPPPDQGDGGGLPLEVLKLPFMQALMAGAPPAVSDRIKDFTTKPFAKTLFENKDLLTQAGIFFYRSLSGELGVIGNGLHIHPADVLAADKAGKLTAIAPDLDKVDHQIAKSGAANPTLHVKAVPGGMKAPLSMATPPQAGAAAAEGPPGPSSAPVGVAASGPPAGAQRRLLQARLTSLQPGAPTSGPSPGTGRLLNSILKPVV